MKAEIAGDNTDSSTICITFGFVALYGKMIRYADASSVKPRTIHRFNL